MIWFVFLDELTSSSFSTNTALRLKVATEFHEAWLAERTHPLGGLTFAATASSTLQTEERPLLILVIEERLEVLVGIPRDAFDSTRGLFYFIIIFFF